MSEDQMTNTVSDESEQDAGTDTTGTDTASDDTAGTDTAGTDTTPDPATDDTSDQTQEQPADTPADSDPSAGQSESGPTDETDDHTDDQSTDEPGYRTGDSDQPTGQSEDGSVVDQPQDDPAVEMDDPQAGDRGPDAGQASGDIPLSPAPTRPYGPESWRPLVTEMADDMPVAVLLRWIKHESGGNPCSTGKIVNGASIENGLFQLYSPDDDHFASPAQLHGSFCSGQTCTRDLSLQEARVQVASGIAYVRMCRERARAQLKQAGVTWDESGTGFWSLVKLQHNLPSVPKQYIPKLRPSSWSAFKQGVLKEHPDYAKSTIFSNAEDIGSAAI